MTRHPEWLQVAADLEAAAREADPKRLLLAAQAGVALMPDSLQRRLCVWMARLAREGWPEKREGGEA